MASFDKEGYRQELNDVVHRVMDPVVESFSRSGEKMAAWMLSQAIDHECIVRVQDMEIAEYHHAVMCLEKEIEGASERLHAIGFKSGTLCERLDKFIVLNRQAHGDLRAAEEEAKRNTERIVKFLGMVEAENWTIQDAVDELMKAYQEAINPAVTTDG